jgi:hypothetical protein
MRFVPLPIPQRASFDLARNPRTPEPWVMAQLDGSTSHRNTIEAKSGAAAASSKKHCTQREWCPASLVDPGTPRRPGRTETLTGQALHTSSSKAATRKQQDSMNQIWKGIDGSERIDSEFAVVGLRDDLVSAAFSTVAGVRRLSRTQAHAAVGNAMTVRPVGHALVALNGWFR